VAAASEANHRRVVVASGEASERQHRQAKAAGRRTVVAAGEREMGRALRGDREGRREESSIDLFWIFSGLDDFTFGWLLNFQPELASSKRSGNLIFSLMCSLRFMGATDFRSFHFRGYKHSVQSTLKKNCHGVC
jgi:hypothetical protein